MCVMCGCHHIRAIVCTWKSEGQPVGVGSQSTMRVLGIELSFIRLGLKHLYLLSHPTGPS